MRLFVISLLTLFLGVAPSFAQSGQGRQLSRLPLVSCTERDIGCFESTRDALSKSTDQINRWVSFQSTKSLSSPIKERSPVGVVIFPGLFASADQFRELSEKIVEAGFFVLHVSLPGHWGQEAKAGEVTAADWLEESSRAIRIAHVMAEKVIVLGHSMGGMLAINAALTRSLRVDGLIAMEPAVRVMPYVESLICNLKPFGINKGDFPRIIRMLTGSDPTEEDRYQSIGMGCEVTKLREKMLNEIVPPSWRLAATVGSIVNPVGAVSELQKSLIEMKLSRLLGELIPVPSLFLVNTTDIVVRSDNTLALVTGIPSKVSRKIVKFGGINHGALTFSNSKMVEAETMAFINHISLRP